MALVGSKPTQAALPLRDTNIQLLLQGCPLACPTTVRSRVHPESPSPATRPERRDVLQAGPGPLAGWGIFLPKKGPKGDIYLQGLQMVTPALHRGR